MTTDNESTPVTVPLGPGALRDDVRRAVTTMAVLLGQGEPHHTTRGTVTVNAFQLALVLSVAAAAVGIDATMEIVSPKGRKAAP